MAKLDRFIIDNTTYELAPEIAPLFNPATPYSVGDCVIHDAVLYKFTANHTGAWTGNDVEAFEVADRLNKISDSVAPEFSASASYTAGQMVLKNGVLYKFTAAHTGAWTGTDVKTVTVGEELTDLTYNENCIEWWKPNDSVFYGLIPRKQNALKHIHDIRIFTHNKNDSFVLNSVYTNASTQLIVHVKEVSTSEEYSFILESTTPVWASKTNYGRTVKILYDTDRLRASDAYINTSQNIAVNDNCIFVTDNTFTEEFLPSDAKATGERFSDVGRILPLYPVKYDWSFFGSNDNPLGWVKGNYVSTTGDSNTQNFYMRTFTGVNIIQSIPGARKFTVTAPEGYAVHVCEFDANTDAFVKTYGLNDIRSNNATRSVTVNVEYGKNYKFAVGRWADNNAESSITSSFINSIELIVYANYDYQKINDYYFPYLDDVVDSINAKADEISSKSFGFVFITDFHYLRNALQSPKLINYLMKKTGIHTVVFGGDAFQNWKDKAEQNEYVNLVYSMLGNSGEKDYYCITGNHEWNETTGEENTQAGVNAMTTNRDRFRVIEMDEYGDYFIDDVMTKTRIFFLSTSISGSMPWTSILWLGNKLLDVPTGYNVMVIAHVGVLKENGVIYQKNTYMNVSKLLGAFDRSESVSLYDSSSMLKGTFDYTSKDGTTICYLCGHTHEDMHITKADDENGVLLVCVTGDLYKNAAGTHYTFVDGNGNTVTRDAGTIYEQAFDVIQIDTVAKKVYCTRVGAGLDREFAY